MDPTLASVYSAIIPSAPYVIAAYVLVWVVLFIFCACLVAGMKRSERKIKLLEEQVDRLKKQTGKRNTTLI